MCDSSRPVTSATLQYYDRNAAAVCARYEAADVRDLRQWLLDWVPASGRVLELGSGSGREAAFLQEHGCEVTATDGSGEMLREAARLHPRLAGHTVQLALPRPFPFPDECFDAVLAAAGLMHLTLPAIAGSLAEVHRVLKPGARMLLSVPVSRTDVGENGLDDHGRRFTQLPAPRWHALAEAAGLALVSQHESADGLKRDHVRWLNAVYAKAAPADAAQQAASSASGSTSGWPATCCSGSIRVSASTHSVRIPAGSAKTREALSQYIARAPISLSKLVVEDHAATVLYQTHLQPLLPHQP